MKKVVLIGDVRYFENCIYESLPITYTKEMLFKTQYYQLEKIEDDIGYYKLLFEIGDEAQCV